MTSFAEERERAVMTEWIRVSVSMVPRLYCDAGFEFCALL
jgi:hypothetical protein